MRNKTSQFQHTSFTEEPPNSFFFFGKKETSPFTNSTLYYSKYKIQWTENEEPKDQVALPGISVRLTPP